MTSTRPSTTETLPEKSGEGWGFPVVYDALIAERDGRKPHQFPGWDTWDESEEAKACFEKGLAEARETQRDFWAKEVPVSLWPIGPERDMEAKRARPKRRTRR